MYVYVYVLDDDNYDDDDIKQMNYLSILSSSRTSLTFDSRRGSLHTLSATGMLPSMVLMLEAYTNAKLPTPTGLLTS